MASVTDLFDRANSTDLGANWTPSYGAGFNNCQIISQRVRGVVATTGDNNEIYTGTSFGAAQEGTITIGSWSADGGTEYTVGVVVRAPNPSPPETVSLQDGYLGLAVHNDSRYGGGKTTVILKRTDGADVVLASETATTWAVGNTLRFVANGTSLAIYRNGSGTPLLSTTDGTYTSGLVGLNIWTNGEPTIADDVSIETWNGADVVAAGNIEITPPSMIRGT